MQFFKALSIHLAACAIASAPLIGLCALICWLCASCTTVDQSQRVDDDPQTMPLIVVPF